MATQLDPQESNSVYNKEYYIKNRERLLLKCKQRYITKPEKYRLRAKTWRDSNLERAKYCEKLQRAKHKEAIKQYMVKYHEDPSTRMRVLCYNASKRATKHGYRFDDSLLKKLLLRESEICKCCGKVLDYSRGKGNNKLAPSLDRVDSSKGYTVDNVEVICVRCNLIKNDGTIEEHEAIVKYMRER